MSRAVVLAALLGACSGVAGGALGGWIATRDPGGPGTIRGDLDALRLATLDARTRHADAVAAVARRVEALETAVAARAAPDADDVAAALRDLAADLQALRDAVARDLGNADARLSDIERRISGLQELAAIAPPAPRRGPLSEEEEGFWYTVAGDADPYRRFSALNILGRTRTDRSVRASLDGLHDPHDLVVCQAAKNLGSFGERSAARELAALLADARANVRHAAHEALRALGAPETGFDPSALSAQRSEATRRLQAWAADVQ